MNFKVGDKVKCKSDRVGRYSYIKSSTQEFTVTSIYPFDVFGPTSMNLSAPASRSYRYSQKDFELAQKKENPTYQECIEILNLKEKI